MSDAGASIKRVAPFTVTSIWIESTMRLAGYERYLRSASRMNRSCRSKRVHWSQTVRCIRSLQRSNAD